ncbi:MAG: hypothetical protein MJ151_03870, partial [Lachnospiraceae bacterium]|nr:hypothetical protein [Lachnospiraceae bacterium]
YEENGAFVTNSWKELDGFNYYFDENGLMATGLKKIGKFFYAFKNDGKPYRVNETYTFNGDEYAIGSKGKIKDMEEDVTDEMYNAYLQEIAAEKAQAAAFKAEQQAYAEERAKAQKEYELAHAEEIAAKKKAQEEARAAAAAEAEAKRNFLLNDENDAKLSAAVKKGNNHNACANSLKVEVKNQLNVRRVELIEKAKADRVANPMAEIGYYSDQYNEIILAYGERLDTILSVLFSKYNVKDEDKRSAIIDDFADVLSQMKESFDKQLDEIG